MHTHHFVHGCIGNRAGLVPKFASWLQSKRKAFNCCMVTQSRLPGGVLGYLCIMLMYTHCSMSSWGQGCMVLHGGLYHVSKGVDTQGSTWTSLIMGDMDSWHLLLQLLVASPLEYCEVKFLAQRNNNSNCMWVNRH